jgi:hypothetical protein
MKARDRALTFDDLKPVFAKGADVQRRAWEKNRAQLPSPEELRKGFTGATKLYGTIIVNGGAPVWEWATTPEWGKRIYVAGPFSGSK